MNNESEKILLCCLLIDINLFEKKEIFSITSEYFEKNENAIIFSVLKKAFQKGLEEIKGFLVPEIKKTAPENAEKILKYGNECWKFAKKNSETFNAATASYHAEIIQESFLRKKTISFAESLKKVANNPSKSSSEIILALEAGIDKISDIESNTKLFSASEMVNFKLDDISRKEGLGEDYYIRSGFKEFDEIFHEGFAGSKLTIIGARPAMGKSAFTLNLAERIAKKGKGVLFISLEMGKIQVTDRMIASDSEINLNDVKRIDKAEEAQEQFSHTINQFAKIPFYLSEGSSNIEEIVHDIRKTVKRKQVKVVIIDYLQLMTSSGSKWMNRAQEVGTFSRTLKILANELDIHIIAISQLTREVEKRTDKRPMMSDIRESGSIEQDADSIIFLYRPNYYLSEEEREVRTDGGEKVEIIVAKQREGTTGNCNLLFRGYIQRFDDFPEEGQMIASKQERETALRDEFPF